MTDITTILTGGSNNFQTTAEHLNYPATDFVNDGVVGAITNTSGVAPMTGALAGNAQGTPDKTVAVSAGVAYVTATPTGQASQRLRVNVAAQNVTHASNATGGTRYDWVYATINATNANNPSAAGSNVVSLTVSRSTSAVTDNGTPPTYGLPIYIATLTNGYSSITNGNIADVRVRAMTHARVGDGWVPANETWTYASATTITVPTDATVKYSVGDKIKLSQGGAVKYFYVTAVAATLLTITGGSDYTLANAQIYGPQFSHQSTPNGFPQYFNFSPGWTNTTLGTGGSQTGNFTIIGRKLYGRIELILGTSGASLSGSATFSTPVTAASSYTNAKVYMLGVAYFLCAGQNYAGYLFFPAAGLTLIQPGFTVQASAQLLGIGTTSPATWTNNDYIRGHFEYEI